MTCRSFSFLAQFPLRPQKAISAPFGKEQNCAALKKERNKPHPQLHNNIKAGGKKHYYLWQAYLWDIRCGLRRHRQELRGKAFHLWLHFMAHGELHCGTWLGKPAAPGWVSLCFALKQPRDGGVWELGSNAASPPCAAALRATGLAHCEDMCRLPPVQQTSLGRLLCSKQGRDQHQVPRMFSPTCALPWGNHCTLQHGWTIFKVFFLAATHGPTGSAISLCLHAPLAQFPLLFQQPSTWGFPGWAEDEMGCAPWDELCLNSIFWAPLKFEKHLRSPKACFMKPHFLHTFKNNRSCHRYFSSHSTDVKALLKPRELQVSASVSPFKFLLSMSPGSSFFCKAWSYCCICRRWSQLYGSDPQFVLVRENPGLHFYKKLPTAHSLLRTGTRRRHNFHVLAAADFSARKNIFTLLFWCVCVRVCVF